MRTRSHRAPAGNDLVRRASSGELLAGFESLHPRKIDLSLCRMYRLLTALGNPERRLAPVVHVAGTNGKGSTVAFLRAIATRAGLRAHVYTSPHLIDFHERIELACENGSAAISDECLRRHLAAVADANAGNPITYFEATTAAAFLAFAERPADLVILETGLGGRLDATNVIDSPRATVITPISLDHLDFLGTSLPEIAREKSGILKPSVPCIVAPQSQRALDVIERVAADIGAPLYVAGRDFAATVVDGSLQYRSRCNRFEMAVPQLQGDYQYENAAVAIAASEIAFRDRIGAAVVANGVGEAKWRARLERLETGTLLSCVSPRTEIIVDGTHNPGGAFATAATLNQWQLREPKELHLVWGMVEGKDARGFISPFKDLVSQVYTVTIPKLNEAMPAQILAEIAASEGFRTVSTQSVPHALMLSRAAMQHAGRVLISGSLYLAGRTIELNG